MDFVGVADQVGRSARNCEELLEGYGLTAAATAATGLRLLGLGGSGPIIIYRKVR